MTRDAVKEVRRHFDASPEAVRDARQFLADTLGDRADDELTEALALTLSELATNAVVHAGTDFDVVIGTDGQVRIEVEDGSTDPPMPRTARETEAGGRGLQIVNDLCDRWGYHVVRNRKCVWCERDFPARDRS
jgi:anti-sigma regulatory factor (Ser/Thr protein kinase)